MNGDFISRQAVLDKAYKLDLSDTGNDICIWVVDVDEVEKLPTAEKPGKWVLMSDCTGKYYACSWCGHEGYSGMKYCPNCGAKMTEESE